MVFYENFFLSSQNYVSKGQLNFFSQTIIMKLLTNQAELKDLPTGYGSTLNLLYLANLKIERFVVLHHFFEILALEEDSKRIKKIKKAFLVQLHSTILYSRVTKYNLEK